MKECPCKNCLVRIPCKEHITVTTSNSTYLIIEDVDKCPYGKQFIEFKQGKHDIYDRIKEMCKVLDMQYLFVWYRNNIE